jgi:hypothetical protein
VHLVFFACVTRGQWIWGLIQVPPLDLLKYRPWLIFSLQFPGLVCSSVLASAPHPVGCALTFVSESLLPPDEVSISARLCSIVAQPGSVRNREHRPGSLLSSCNRCPARDFLFPALIFSVPIRSLPPGFSTSVFPAQSSRSPSFPPDHRAPQTLSRSDRVARVTVPC